MIAHSLTQRNLSPQSVAIANNQRSEMLACIAIFIYGRKKPVVGYSGNSQRAVAEAAAAAAENVCTIYRGAPHALLGILIAVTIPVLHLSCRYVMIYSQRCLFEDAVHSLRIAEHFVAF